MTWNQRGNVWWTQGGQWRIEYLPNGLYRVDDRKSGLVWTFSTLGEAQRRAS